MMNERILREAECEEITGLSASTRWRLERSGHFPKRRRLSRNLVGWLHSEVEEWMRSRPATAGTSPSLSRIESEDAIGSCGGGESASQHETP